MKNASLWYKPSLPGDRRNHQCLAGFAMPIISWENLKPSRAIFGSLQMDHGWRLDAALSSWISSSMLMWCHFSWDLLCFHTSGSMGCFRFEIHWVDSRYPYGKGPKELWTVTLPLEVKTLEASWNAKRCGWDWRHCWRSLVYRTAAWRASKRLPFGGMWKSNCRLNVVG